MSKETDPSKQVWNVPNVLSMARLILAFVVFGLIEFGQFFPAFVCFVIAAGTDWMDGWYARKFNQVTQLGRILDPFCDKVIICGTFIQIAAVMAGLQWPWYMKILPSIAVLIMAREILVTALRSFVESGGGNFSASMAGKLKMVFQCVAAGAALLALTYVQNDSEKNVNLVPTWIVWPLIVSLWLAVLTTISSGWDYVWAAIKFAKEN